MGLRHHEELNSIFDELIALLTFLSVPIHSLIIILIVQHHTYVQPACIFIILRIVASLSVHRNK